MLKVGLAAIGAFLATASIAVAGSSGIHLLKSVTLGGDTFWDCITLDAPSHRVFIAHGSHVVVADSRTGAAEGDIPGVDGAHEVAIANSFGKGYATAGKSDSVVVFDAKTLKTTGTIKVGSRPDGILYDPATRRVFTFNAGSKDATVIDVASGTVDGTIPLGGKPEFAVLDGKGHIFDNVEDTSEIVEIDAKSMSVMKRWKLAPCTEPSGLAFDRGHHRLFAACDNEMMAAVDSETGKVVATIPTGKGADGAGFDAKSGNIIVPEGGDARMSVIREVTPNTYRLIENVQTQKGARTMDLDPASGRIYTVTADLAPDPGQHPPYKMAPGSFRLLIYGR
ncbi:MAG TPA: YncE family protein [Rhizomicrobium sp.]|jgi:YVTN family beta-propeller protein|nr:YncE family protein [Rhizomicrobium sp.]